MVTALKSNLHHPHESWDMFYLQPLSKYVSILCSQKIFYYFLVMHSWVQCYIHIIHTKLRTFSDNMPLQSCFKCSSILIEMLGMNIHPNSLHSLLKEVCSRRGMTRTSRASAKSKSNSHKSARTSEKLTDVKSKTWSLLLEGLQTWQPCTNMDRDLGFIYLNTRKNTEQIWAECTKSHRKDRLLKYILFISKTEFKCQLYITLYPMSLS